MTLRAGLPLVVLGCVALPALGGSLHDAVTEEHEVSRPAPAAADLGSALDGLFGPLVERNLVSGSVVIARSGKTLVAKGYGLSDREHAAPDTPSAPFRIASVSKARRPWPCSS